MIILLIISTLITQIDTPLQECPSITATAIVKNTTQGLKNGEITIEAKGGKGTLRYFLLKDNRPVNSGKELQKTIANLSAGTYKCSVADESGCIKKLEIELK
jgi:hypothetical protein